MAKQPNSKRGSRPKRAGASGDSSAQAAAPQLAELPPHARPSPLLDTRVIYCGDCLDQLRRSPEQCVDLIYIDPPFNSNRNYEVFWGNPSEPRAVASGPPALFADRYASAEAYADLMRSRRIHTRRAHGPPGSFGLRKSPLTQYHLLSRNAGIALAGSDAADRKDTV
jgi:hypothetical protein